MPRRMHRLAVLALTAAMTLTLAPNAPAVADEPRSLPPGSYPIDGEHIAVPLVGKPPGWYTPELHAQVLSAGDLGLAYDRASGQPIPFPASEFPIQPGAWMVSPSLCTMGFVFGLPGAYSISTAGHCARSGQRVVLALTPTLLVAVGTTYAHRNAGIGQDWALVLIDKAFQPFVDSDIAVVNGPFGGTYKGAITPQAPVPIKFVGNGLVIGTGGTPRSGLAFWTEATAFYFTAASMEGDSGAPVVTASDGSGRPEGQALGLLTHLVVDLDHRPTNMAGTRATAIPGTVVMGDGASWTL